MSYPDPTRRFSNRVRDYVRYRPGYPQSVLEILVRDTALRPEAVVADIGSGTGISSRLFLTFGCEVYGVEPNADMRAAAEAELGGNPRFHSRAGTAEATSLPSASVDYTVAGQAFHWFDRDRARVEFMRILKPGGWVVLMWNTRRTEGNPLVQEYEALLREFGTDYRDVDHKNIAREQIDAFFGRAPHYSTVPNFQNFDREGLRGRLLSSSYAPPAGHPRHEPMLQRLDDIFNRHQADGRVRFEYDTEVFYGRLTTR